MALTEKQVNRSFGEMLALPFDQRPITRSETVRRYTVRCPMYWVLSGLGILLIRENRRFVNLKYGCWMDTKARYRLFVVIMFFVVVCLFFFSSDRPDCKDYFWDITHGSRHLLRKLAKLCGSLNEPDV